MYKGLIDNYKDFFKFKETTVPVTLNEGRTPLIRANNLEKLLGIDIELYFKFEGLNPTGSFKDRGMTSAVTKAVEDGSTAVICASTGNTSASAAAYAARASILKPKTVTPKLVKISKVIIRILDILELSENLMMKYGIQLKYK